MTYLPSTYNLQFYSFSIEIYSPDFLKMHISVCLACKIHFIHITYEIYSNCTNVALCIRIILKMFDVVSERSKICTEMKLTANLKSKQDFPTPESPMSRSLNK